MRKGALNVRYSRFAKKSFWQKMELRGLTPQRRDVVSRWLSRRPSWIAERNDFSNSESLCCSHAFPSSFSTIRLTVWEEILFEEFQDSRHDGHLGYWNRMILAILNLYAALMLPIKFWHNPTYGLGGDVV